MGCEGTAGCCCGDPAAPEKACPRADTAIDPAELPETPMDEAPALPPAPPPLLTADAAAARGSTPDDSSPAPPRPRVSPPLLL
jgi:hypothetical protein